MVPSVPGCEASLGSLGRVSIFNSSHHLPVSSLSPFFLDCWFFRLRLIDCYHAFIHIWQDLLASAGHDVLITCLPELTSLKPSGPATSALPRGRPAGNPTGSGQSAQDQGGLTNPAEDGRFKLLTVLQLPIPGLEAMDSFGFMKQRLQE